MKVSLKHKETADGHVINTLTTGNVYEIIGIEGDDYRIVDDIGEPILFDSSCFKVVDGTEPEFWVSKFCDGARYAYPEEWMRAGFFEDYFDYNQDVRREFRIQYKRFYGGEIAEGERRPGGTTEKG